MAKNKYSLKAVIKNDYVVFKKQYNSRTEALDAAFSYLDKQYIFDVSVLEEFTHNGNKHDIEYVLSNQDRFIVTRI